MRRNEILVVVGLLIISIIAMVVGRMTYDPSGSGASWYDVCIFGPALPPFVAVYVAKRLSGKSKWSFIIGWLAGALALLMVLTVGLIWDYYDPESESCIELPYDLFAVFFISLILGGMISASDSLVMRLIRNWRRGSDGILHLGIRLAGTALLTAIIVWIVFGVIFRC